MKIEELKDSGDVLYLHSGNREAIKAAQKYLNEYGYTDAYGRKLIEDGVFGKNTFNAVIKYQKENGLEEDGKIGDETWSHMWSNSGGKGNSSEHNDYAEKEYNLGGMKVPEYRPKKKVKNDKKYNWAGGGIAPFFYYNFNAAQTAESDAIKEERERQENMDEYIKRFGQQAWYTSREN